MIILSVLLIITADLVYNIAVYIKDNFPDQEVEEMIFYLGNGVGGASSDVIVTAAKQILPPFLLILVVLLIPITRIMKRDNFLEMKIRKKPFRIHLFPLKRLRIVYALIVMTVSLFSVYKILGIDDYVSRMNNASTFIEDHYVSGENVSLDFPDDKKNLIVLYLESMENSFMSKDKGGGWESNVIPELTDIAENNINFSHTEKIGGAVPAPGTDWTAASLVATTSGLPLKIPIDQNKYNSSDSFLKGAHTLGDVLKDEGYQLSAMFGSDASFGGRESYYKSHGDYDVFDVSTAVKQGKMDKEDKVWWGFDDSHLFKWAKEEIDSLASSDQPFQFSFLTANTHFANGYLEEGAGNEYDSQYENVYSYSSKQVMQFVNWLKEQEYYEDTTLVIIGDHLSMQGGGYFPSHLESGYKRTIYNAFVNASADPVQTKNRDYSTLDFYPSILSAMGVTIEGDRLGLGTDLFSGKKTLLEEYSQENVFEELKQKSNFYNTRFLQDDYFELKDKAEEHEKNETKDK